MKITSILKDFSKLADARKKQTMTTRLAFVFCSLTIAMVLYFCYNAMNNAMNKILVVNTGGEYLQFQATQNDELYENLLKSHCYYTSYYINSFDRQSIEQNQARAMFLVNKVDANTIFAKYNADRAYGDALELGVSYRCEFENINSIVSRGDEYDVSFDSVLTIYSHTGTKKILITSTGTVIRTKPNFPNNVTGFFFSNYNQDYRMYEE